MSCVFSIAEAIESVVSKDKKTIFCVLDEFDGEFPDFQAKSLKAAGEMVKLNEGNYVTSLDEVVEILNNM